MPFYLVLVIKPKALELLGKRCPLSYILSSAINFFPKIYVRVYFACM